MLPKTHTHPELIQKKIFSFSQCVPMSVCLGFCKYFNIVICKIKPKPKTATATATASAIAIESKVFWEENLKANNNN